MWHEENCRQWELPTCVTSHFEKNTAPEHLKHELFLNRLREKLPVKRTASSDCSKCFCSRHQWGPRCLLLQLSAPLSLIRLTRYYSAFQLLYRHTGKGKFGLHFFYHNLPLVFCNKYARSVCCHFSLEFNMCYFLCCFTGRIRKQQKGVTRAWRTTVDFCE